MSILIFILVIMFGPELYIVLVGLLPTSIIIMIVMFVIVLVKRTQMAVLAINYLYKAFFPIREDIVQFSEHSVEDFINNFFLVTVLSFLLVIMFDVIAVVFVNSSNPGCWFADSERGEIIKHENIRHAISCSFWHSWKWAPEKFLTFVIFFYQMDRTKASFF
jgi:hypothetical protein